MLDEFIERAIAHLIGRAFDKQEQRTSENYRESIMNAETAEEAMEMREQYRAHKKSVPYSALVISLLIFVISLVIASMNNNVEIVWSAIPLAVAPIVFTFISNIFKNQESVQAISVYTKEEFLSSHNDFILYLRPFDSDKYDNFSSYQFADPEVEQNEDGETIPVKTRTFPSFSEKLLVDELEMVQGAPVCAIGMTKEAEHPDGAIRIYVSDKTWQQDVSEMMEKAKTIIILVADKESCIWEIEQTSKYLNKTIFIIEDQDIFNCVREKTGQKMELPAITDNDDKSQRYVLYHDDGRFTFSKYDHTPEGYRQLSLSLLKTILPLNIKGIFTIVDQAFKNINNYDFQSETILEEMSESLLKMCPQQINNHLRLDSSDFLGINKLIICCTIQDNHIDFNEVRHHLFPITNALLEQFIIETSDSLQDMVTVSTCSFDIIIDDQSHEERVLANINSSQIEKRININRETFRII